MKEKNVRCHFILFLLAFYPLSSMSIVFLCYFFSGAFAVFLTFINNLFMWTQFVPNLVPTRSIFIKLQAVKQIAPFLRHPVGNFIFLGLSVTSPKHTTASLKTDVCIIRYAQISFSSSHIWSTVHFFHRLPYLYGVCMPKYWHLFTTL